MPQTGRRCPLGDQAENAHILWESVRVSAQLLAQDLLALRLDPLYLSEKPPFAQVNLDEKTRNPKFISVMVEGCIKHMKPPMRLELNSLMLKEL
ncbi:hypothetical protein VKT23_016702 [Stygiomarasmius scandens]|uniref:Uncharacterized protein n=1 Tax=Marasmiellus scandens TaxID=2682957 RepID=A0ABR1IUE4_9AGAR